ncbi:MAG: ABC transporter substrate-binding protein [Candidatus Brocadiaceae bacterium]|nr:ABC transporter substrate-binding protein [Candidatus Brocadiaceae bacterium]
MQAAFVCAFAVVLGVPFLLRPEPVRVQEGNTSDLPSRKLVIVTPHAEAIRREFARAFAEWTAETRGFLTDIEWLDPGGTTTAIQWVEDQFESRPGGIEVDIFFGGGSDPFLRFSQLGLLHRCSLPAEVLAPIPQSHAGTEVYDAGQLWFGACLSGFGILYNKAVLGVLGLPEPREWADLGRPGFFSWVAGADPRQSGSIHMAFEIILQAYGWETGWRNVMRMCANCRSFSRGASDVPLDVSAGEAACGMAIDTYGLRAVAEAGEDRMAFCLPQALTVINPDGIGVLKGAPDAELAELFVGFVLSEHGQRIWMQRAGTPGGPARYGLYRLPVMRGLVERYRQYAAVGMDPYEFESGVEFDLDKKNRRWGILNALIGACIIDVHTELAAAWRVLRDLPEGDPRVRALLEPPISEDDLLRMAEDRWGDAAFRADMVARWSQEAKTRYRRLAKER